MERRERVSSGPMDARTMIKLAWAILTLPYRKIRKKIDRIQTRRLREIQKNWTDEDYVKNTQWWENGVLVKDFGQLPDGKGSASH